MHVAEALGFAGDLGFAAYKADKAHNGGKITNWARRKLGEKPLAGNSVDNRFDNNNHHEPRNSQNNITEHNTPPSGYSERPSGLLVLDSISHSQYRNMPISFIQNHRLR